ncbi:MAG: DUF2274 domain-containing protein [Sphingomonas sp.]|jgi:hypothetical protein|uniref:DUF2274 domain-containing protein n=1 Tax=Alphaproteobacteria TaxID=28211 RepID=UPI001AE6645E|nr:DUF2274 domain-containing protein [Sphingomonas sp. BE137]MDR6849923.1 hypothetical protein [Sphingomonas sp. BE137]
MTKLRLGRIEDDRPVKLTIELPGAVHRELLRYAQEHARETGLDRPLAIERLVPPMLERFMDADRGFVRRKRGQA